VQKIIVIEIKFNAALTEINLQNPPQDKSAAYSGPRIQQRTARKSGRKGTAIGYEESSSGKRRK
jgi:hypothetical protein